MTSSDPSEALALGEAILELFADEELDARTITIGHGRYDGRWVAQATYGYNTPIAGLHAGAPSEAVFSLRTAITEHRARQARDAESWLESRGVAR